VEKASGGNTLETSDTADKTCPEKTLGRDVVKNITGSSSSSRVNKRKAVDIVELTESEFAVDEGEKSSDLIGGTEAQHKKKRKHSKWHFLGSAH
jgi:hypothetical protein